MWEVWSPKNIKEALKQQGSSFKVYQMKHKTSTRAQKTKTGNGCRHQARPDRAELLWEQRGTGVFRWKNGWEEEDWEADCILTQWQPAVIIYRLQCWPAKHTPNTHSCSYKLIGNSHNSSSDVFCKWCRLQWRGWRMKTSHQHILTDCCSTSCVCTFCSCAD